VHVASTLSLKRTTGVGQDAMKLHFVGNMCCTNTISFLQQRLIILSIHTQRRHIVIRNAVIINLNPIRLWRNFVQQTLTNGTHQLLVSADGLYFLVGIYINKNTKTLLIAIKEAGLEVNANKTKYMFMSRQQNAEQDHDIKTANRFVCSTQCIKANPPLMHTL
jgi:uncharacterized protein (DUF2235 family)